MKLTFIILGIALIVAVATTFVLSKENLSINDVLPFGLKGITERAGEELTTISYKDNNMTIEFKERTTTIGTATLKSHKTYDEVLEITSGEDRVLVWYEFSDFNEIQRDALKEVVFIDMREEIADESLLKEGGFIEEENINIPNPNYLKPIEKNYTFVYLDEKENWVDYNSKDIPKENVIIGVQTDLGWGEYLDVVFNIFNNKLDRHALVLGTNCGFVTTAPTADPAGSATVADSFSMAMKHTSPATAGKITEIGFWVDPSYPGQESNFEVGIYSDDATGAPHLLLPGESRTNAKGTTSGWKRVTGLDITISSNTIYWIAVQVDNTPSVTATDLGNVAGTTRVAKYSQSTLPSDWGGSDASATNVAYAFYAVWEEAEEPSPESCASYSSGVWYVPKGCECYYQGDEVNLNLSLFSCREV